MTEERMIRILMDDATYDVVKDEGLFLQGYYYPEPVPPKDFVPKCAEIIALDRTLLCSVCDKNKECIYRKKESKFKSVIEAERAGEWPPPSGQTYTVKASLLHDTPKWKKE